MTCLGAAELSGIGDLVDGSLSSRINAVMQIDNVWCDTYARESRGFALFMV
jgi:hypothetical protein